jgi:DNA-directed RNA polymerase specialized sigma subunit
LLDQYGQHIQAASRKWKGVLPDAVIDAHANRHALDALKTYSPGRGTVNTHISSRMQQLGRLNYEHSNVAKIPEHQIMHLGRLKQQRTLLEDTLDREPTHEELAKVMKMPKAHIKRILANSRADLVNDSDRDQIGQMKHNYERANRLAGYRHSLGGLEQRQFDDITGFGGADPMSPKQIGTKYGLTPSQVSKLKSGFAVGLK